MAKGEGVKEKKASLPKDQVHLTLYSLPLSCLRLLQTRHNHCDSWELRCQLCCILSFFDLQAVKIPADWASSSINKKTIAPASSKGDESTLVATPTPISAAVRRQNSIAAAKAATAKAEASKKQAAAEKKRTAKILHTAVSLLPNNHFSVSGVQ